MKILFKHLDYAEACPGGGTNIFIKQKFCPPKKFASGALHTRGGGRAEYLITAKRERLVYSPHESFFKQGQNTLFSPGAKLEGAYALPYFVH